MNTANLDSNESVVRVARNGQLVPISETQVQSVLAADPDADLLVPWSEQRTNYIRHDIARFMLWFGRPLREVTTEDICSYLDALKVAGPSVPLRVATALNPLFKMLASAGRMYLIHVSTSRSSTGVRLPQLSPHQLQLVVRALRRLSADAASLADRIENGKRISDEQVREVSLLLDDNDLSQHDIAKKAGVSQATVYRIRQKLRQMRAVAE